MKLISRKKSTEELTYSVTSKELRDILIDAGRISKKDTVKAVFQVPGGGDYSNMALEIDSECPIILTVIRGD